MYKKDEWSFVVSKKSSLLQILRLLKSRLKHQKRLQDLKKAERNIIRRNQKTLPDKTFFK
ncbi:MAG: hypothetical protein A2998_01250 [Candidatus Staskawiczbacteria bacterium RIFCSPLOWO2_01_FULL_37_25b]|uniref:Uncharacterized protein n=2 Tax=Candidatus Staskawicziibacteriota TaxID=1817916 RepID=A0A1G2HP10_9BACT|nr:MAG: hypothetical protein A2812_03065 [Candidatus Staskawiczbacteria bacterium RIFCSPHIGHO2_01_FULL_36_16]OGZ72993.1 MAG: hypothetical protein A2998_01250 [Candidatus Staskawiczbacteria bacterium RIFCSPLOWO2_01_FULL_37_25b]